MSPLHALRALGLVMALTVTPPALAATWSTTEVHYQYGHLDAPFGTDGLPTHVTTLQHASGWALGENFFFIDYLQDTNNDAFNDGELYAEWYPSLSLSKLTGQDLQVGPLADVALLGGVNVAAQAKTRKYLPGIRLSWALPGFDFLNTDITAYLDDSAGLDAGGVPREGDAFMVDINGRLPFRLGGHYFSLEGHIEYIGARATEGGGRAPYWVLAQPQFRYDLGQVVWGEPNRMLAGMEWQVWINKLGDEKTDENAPQFLAVWRF